MTGPAAPQVAVIGLGRVGLPLALSFASHGVRAAFQRPRLQRPGVPDFYFVGGSTPPGEGCRGCA